MHTLFSHDKWKFKFYKFSSFVKTPASLLTIYLDLFAHFRNHHRLNATENFFRKKNCFLKYQIFSKSL